MTVIDEINILNRKIKQNEGQCDLDREAAKISALSSKNLDKCEYLTGEDLGHKPSTVEQAKFEYTPLGKIFNKGLSEHDEKEGLLKRLKNIEGKSKEQLKAIEDQGKKQLDANSKSLKSINHFQWLSPVAKKLFTKIKNERDNIDPEKLVCVKD